MRLAQGRSWFKPRTSVEIDRELAIRNGAGSEIAGLFGQHAEAITGGEAIERPEASITTRIAVSAMAISKTRNRRREPDRTEKTVVEVCGLGIVASLIMKTGLCQLLFHSAKLLANIISQTQFGVYRV